MNASGLCAVPIMELGISSIRQWPIPVTQRPDNGPVSYCGVALSRWFGKAKSEASADTPSAGHSLNSEFHESHRQRAQRGKVICHNRQGLIWTQAVPVSEPYRRTRA